MNRKHVRWLYDALPELTEKSVLTEETAQRLRAYMNERDAPEAERVYRQHSLRGGARDAYIVVRVLNGTPVLEELYVGDRPILEFLAEPPPPEAP